MATMPRRTIHRGASFPAAHFVSSVLKFAAVAALWIAPVGAQVPPDLAQAFDTLEEAVSATRAAIPREISFVSGSEVEPVRETHAAAAYMGAGASAMVDAGAFPGQSAMGRSDEIQWEPSADLLTRIQGSLAALRISSSDINVEHRAAYAASIQHSAGLVDLARSCDPDMAQLILGDVELDLRIKLLSRSSGVNGPRLEGRVPVAVTTKRSGRVVCCYMIRLNPVRWTAANYFGGLDNATTPAEGSSTPGVFDIIVLRNGHEVTRDQGREIGLGGTNQFEVQVP